MLPQPRAYWIGKTSRKPVPRSTQHRVRSRTQILNWLRVLWHAQRATISRKCWISTSGRRARRLPTMLLGTTATLSYAKRSTLVGEFRRPNLDLRRSSRAQVWRGVALMLASWRRARSGYLAFLRASAIRVYQRWGRSQQDD